LVDLARKEKDRAAALSNYARITAPFDGEITRRTVNVGDFVQNASTGSSEPVMRVARTDLVTVVMRVPDNAAPYVALDTEAVMQFDGMPGVELRGTVSRFARSIRGEDRTMRVEVDVFNGTRVQYERFLAKNVGGWLAPLAARGPAELANLLGAADSTWLANSKGEQGAFPVCVAGASLPETLHLIPGTSGYMRLNLKQFRGACLVPSGVVYTKGGTSYVLLIKDGVTQELPARVQVDDGRIAKIAVVVQAADPARGLREVLRDLTPEDTLVLNRQVEVGGKRPVKATMASW
jgi:multidrug efflux pump subunit AcrA (membrane-fusion protein)